MPPLSSWFGAGATSLLERTAHSYVWEDVIIKGTLLMLLALAAVSLLRHCSAAVRHRVWGLMFVGLLLLPVLSYTLPQWQVPVLPPPSEEMIVVTARGSDTSDHLVPPPEIVLRDVTASPTLSSEDLRVDEHAFTPVGLAPPVTVDETASQRELAGAAGMSQTAAADDLSATQRPPLAAWIGLALLIWLAGAMLVLLPLLGCVARNMLLWIRCPYVHDADWQALLDELRARLRLRRHVDLLRSPRPLVPMTWGLVRPVILLPDQAGSWSGSLRRFVLLHELAHVKRCDVGFQMLARLACAVYWFHPLVWYGLRRLRIERELACDDCVVMAGERPTDYARQLLDIARSCRPTGMVAAVAMAHRSTLEQRIRALLDRARPHVPLSTRFAVCLLAVSATIVTGVAVVTPAAKEIAPVATVPGEDSSSSRAGSEATTVSEDPGEPLMITVRGQVVLPGGGPAAGAIVRAAAPMFAMLKPIVGEDFEPAIAEVGADADGQFEISFSSRPYGQLDRLDEQWQEAWKRTTIAASLPGYGPQWVTYEQIKDPKQPILLTLVEDVPIEGYVVDLEGQPLAGVSVAIGGPSASENEDLSAWIEAATNGEPPWTIHNHLPRSVEPKLIGMPESWTSDRQGRITIRGVGRERRLSLTLQSESVAHRQISVVSRPMEPIQRIISTPPFEGHETVYGAEFTFTAAPARTIIGTVRDADSGEPMPGVAVESYKLADYPYSNHRVLKTVTDAEGHYRLTGVPKGDGNKVLVLPSDDQPYLMRQIDIANPPGLAPVAVDIEVHRGVWITGRITDKVTGEPVNSARVYYLPFRSNEFAQALPEFDDNGNVDGDQLRYTSKPDGTYRLVGLPGRAIVGASSVLRQYREGVGYDAIKGPYYRDSDYLDTYRNPVYPSPKWPNVMAEINPAADAASVSLDLEMDPGLSIPIRLVGPDDQPLVGVDVTGYTSIDHITRIEGDRFEATQFGPGETRTLLFHHHQQNLGWVARLSPKDAEDNPITIQLQPVATLRARLLQEDGSPLTGVEINAWPLPSGDFAKRLPAVTSNADGHFTHILLPGADYSITAEGLGLESVENITQMLTVDPGETRDLGELRLVEGEFVSTGNSRPAQSSLLKLHGYVLAPDGQPHREASIWVRQPLASRWTLIDRTTSGGRFSAAIDRARIDAALARNPHTKLRLVATAKDYGLAWANVDVTALDQEVALQLVEDVPIEGRLVTIEGQPVAGATVSLEHVLVNLPMEPNDYLEQAKHTSVIWFSSLMDAFEHPLTESVMTNSDGGFRLQGLGAERLVRLKLHGDGIAHGRLAVLTRQPRDDAAASGVAVDRAPPNESIYYARFTHVVPPGRALRGVLRDAQTGAPIAGAEVSTHLTTASPVKTEEDGRFELHGCLKTDTYQLDVRAANSKHFNGRKFVQDAAGLQPLDVELTLSRGIPARGRVVDAETGEAVRGTVEYYALFPNLHVDRLGDQGEIHRPVADAAIQANGTFELPVLPGPGVIGIRHGDNRYVTAQVDVEELEKMGVTSEPSGATASVEFLPIAAGGQARGAFSLRQYQAVQLINPGENQPAVTVELQLVRGQELKGRIVDQDGQPVTGVAIGGLHPLGHLGTQPPLKSAEFAVQALAPGQERTLLFFHSAKKLGAQRLVSADTAEPLIVRLQPCGAAIGRIVDELGEPMADVMIEFVQTGPAVFGAGYGLGRTDEDGHFRVEGLIPDHPYLLALRVDDRPVIPQDRIVLQAGEVQDLGVLQPDGMYGFIRRAKTEDAGGP